MLDPDAARADSELWAVRVMAPAPGIAEPGVRQDVQLGRLGPAVDCRDATEDVFLVGLGVIDEHVEVAALVQGVANRRTSSNSVARPATGSGLAAIRRGVGVLTCGYL